MFNCWETGPLFPHTSFALKETTLGFQKLPRGCLLGKCPLAPDHPGSCPWLDKQVDSEESIRKFLPVILVPFLGNFIFKTVYYYRHDDSTNAIC